MAAARLIVTEKGRILQKELIKDMMQDDAPTYQSSPCSSNNTGLNITNKYNNNSDHHSDYELPPERTGYFRPKTGNELFHPKHSQDKLYPLYLRKEDNYPAKHSCEFIQSSTTVITPENRKIYRPNFKITHHSHFQGAITPYLKDINGSNLNNNDIMNRGNNTPRNISSRNTTYNNGIKHTKTDLILKVDHENMPSNIKVFSDTEQSFSPQYTGQKSGFETLTSHSPTKSVYFLSPNHKDYRMNQFTPATTTHSNLNRTRTSMSLTRIVKQYDPIKISHIMEKVDESRKEFQTILEIIEQKSNQKKTRVHESQYKNKEFLHEIQDKYKIIEEHENKKIMETKHYMKKVKELHKKKYEIYWSHLKFPQRPNTTEPLNKNIGIEATINLQNSIGSSNAGSNGEFESTTNSAKQEN